MKKPARRPHLTAQGTLCDENPPCSHVRPTKKARELMLLAGTIFGAFVGVAAMMLTFSFFGSRLNWISITVLALAAFWVAAVCYRFLRI